MRYNIHFSPTGGTKKVADILARNLGGEFCEVDICRDIEKMMSPQKVLETADAELQELIRPAGFFKQKCAYLKAVAAFIMTFCKRLLWMHCRQIPPYTTNTTP